MILLGLGLAGRPVRAQASHDVAEARTLYAQANRAPQETTLRASLKAQGSGFFGDGSLQPGALRTFDGRYRPVSGLRYHAGLRLLEAQVNPHFLFNTLNSLYALSLAQSPRTPDLLLALAGLMRYQLESTRRARVPLSEELDYLRSYAQLQEMRLGPRCPVRVALPTEEEAAGRTVAPLLLLALVENAFTHGTRRASGSFVHLGLTLDGPRLTLRIRNALPPPTQEAPGGTGTGLPNTRQRLALLYPGRHELRAAPAATEFQTDLTLDL